MTRCDCACFHCTRDDHYYCPRENGCVLHRWNDPEFDDDEQLHISHAPELEPAELVDDLTVAGVVRRSSACFEGEDPWHRCDELCLEIVRRR